MQTNQTIIALKQFPSDLLALVKRAAKAYPQNITKAEQFTYDRLQKLTSYDDDLVEALIRHALRTLIHDARSVSNHKIRRQAGQTRKPAEYNKVDTAKSPTLKRLHKNWYNYCIAGTTLGSIFGRDLRPLADNERRIAKGRLNNAHLLEALIPLVPANSTVRDAMEPKALDKIARKFLKAA